MSPGIGAFVITRPLDLSTHRPIDPLHLLKVGGHWKIASEFYVGYPQ
ncbi:hypothetical protein PV762_01745 [Mitsuaria sp. CC2]